MNINLVKTYPAFTQDVPDNQKWTVIVKVFENYRVLHTYTHTRPRTLPCHFVGGIKKLAHHPSMQRRRTNTSTAVQLQVISIKLLSPMLLAGSVSDRPHSKWWWCHDISYPLLAAEHSLCKAPWSGTPCWTTSVHSRTMSPLDSAWKPGFSPATSVLSTLETSWQLRYINSHLPLPLLLPQEESGASGNVRQKGRRVQETCCNWNQSPCWLRRPGMVWKHGR